MHVSHKRICGRAEFSLVTVVFLVIKAVVGPHREKQIQFRCSPVCVTIDRCVQACLHFQSNFVERKFTLYRNVMTHKAVIWIQIM